SRRSILQAGGVAVLAVGAGSALAACSNTSQPAPTTSSSAAPAAPPAGMNFASVAPNSEDAVVVADGYQQGVVISWGDPVLSDAPK
ncbi:phosphatase, partial [Mycobacterium sp. ITM-2017-0098]